ncbi:CDP-glycerol glycerophosphotransferase family protein [Bacillus sp. B-jedd]|uniref:CDP-glycerol glycerophosphotransferase family protein n=1 Tax=Bacillus sp. B-jedd TaxID=1476857 RepID=UPI00051557CD|nr:CDP-glycerol glycerophosphotransferase family protein [Bacillus sp. B-jedd]CEG29085.1 CDP-glycerol:poly(glycerophosphate) glycerophosphotransferase [Bacillus sp. B-jedd]
MVREIAVYIYLRLFSFLFFFSSFVPLKNKTVFVVSFPENSLAVYKELKKQEIYPRIVFLANNKNYKLLSEMNLEVLVFDIRHISHFIRSVFHLATAKVIFVDNYYGFLGAAKFKTDVTCIQLWHANGAIKKFGIKDQGNKNRSHRAIERFEKVYNNFTFVVSGSEPMSEIFQHAFGLAPERIIKTGVPRTDIFYDEPYKTAITKSLFCTYPFLEKKKIILYAPTYRENELEDFEFMLDLKLLHKELGNDYVVLLKLHPAIKNCLSLPESTKGFAYDFSGYGDVNDLLFITDILITDYSSIPFEYSILSRPIIFYPYDLAEYEVTRGFWFNYIESVPGPTVFSSKEIASLIKEDQFDLCRINKFNQEWNKYSTGQASKNLVRFVKQQMELEKAGSAKLKSRLP